MTRTAKMLKTMDLWQKATGRRVLAAAAAAVVACIFAVTAGPPAAAESGFTLTSPAFSHGGQIPEAYTCEGKDISPPLKWQGVPANTRSLVLIVADPDAPDPEAPKITWIHWVLYNIPPDAGGLPEGASPVNLPEGTRKGENSWEKTGYGGPCPPIGKHRYFHKLYAIDTVLEPMANPTRAELQSAMKGHVIAEAELMGTYEKLE